MRLKHFIAVVILCGIFARSYANTPISDSETLNYKVMFKWGLVQKQAGRAALKISDNGTNYVATLIARSESWADKFYSVRDTLISTMTRTDLLPIKYERIAHEGGAFARDIVTITRSGNIFTGETERYRRKKNSVDLVKTTGTLEATGHTVDLLSVFYYLRTINFDLVDPGDINTISIFSGKKKEILNIKYISTEQINIDGHKYNTHKISFIFTTDGKNKSSDDIITWISADSNHIPLKLEGKLKVGKIQCLYVSDK